LTSGTGMSMPKICEYWFVGVLGLVSDFLS